MLQSMSPFLAPFRRVVPHQECPLIAVELTR